MEPELFALRRDALLDSPFAFLASPSDDLAASEAAVSEMLKRAPSSVVFAAGTPRLVGMLGLHRAHQLKAAHKVNLWGMYVVPAWRKRGLGEKLLQAAISYARTLPGVSTVRLSVSGSASAARHLYEKIGFTCWGEEPDAMRIDGLPASEHHMSLSLDPS
ncbi:MAG TPA: GNAT family N-acetyltransferase [Steroidobacteraceae bacterium]